MTRRLMLLLCILTLAGIVASCDSKGTYTVTNDDVREVGEAIVLPTLPAALPRLDGFASTTTVQVTQAPTSEPTVETTTTTSSVSTTTTIPVPPDESIVFPASVFAPDSADLNQSAKTACADTAHKLALLDGYLLVLGHADVRATSFPGGNQPLSEARASNVYLCITQVPGVDLSRVAPAGIYGLGTSCPLDPDPAAAINRRVEVFLYTKLSSVPPEGTCVATS
ncbi:MAG: hypothetical protein JWM34_1085 [Ilumatobacteraceae bacterium]|nr:hypothetical protein [Ilumatobacteraceae bacterium]